MANENGRIGWSNNVITGLEENLLMKNVFVESNKAFLIGVIGEEFKLNHVVKDEKFYRTLVKVERFSGTEDIIPVIVPGIIIKQGMCNEAIGKWAAFCGQFRSYNKTDEYGKTHLELFLFAKRVDIRESKDGVKKSLIKLLNGDNFVNNLVFIDGYLCKKRELRTTPSGTKICDLIIAVNRSCGKTDYIPCIAWEKVAEWTQNLEVGSHVKIYGRIQKRDYYKKSSENPKRGKWKIAYELSVIRIKKLK